MDETKLCNKCNRHLPLSAFYFRSDSGKYRNDCKECIIIAREPGKTAKSEYNKTYYQENKPREKERHQTYYKNNKPKINKQKHGYNKQRLKTDLNARLRKNVSNAIHSGMVAKSQSISKYLPYHIKALKEHLEKQFEPWMTWDNYGRYDVETWDDNNQTTWKWNIDHIIPQSDLPYTSMEEENFHKCWALENLRPYSAKLNALDGGLKNRHGLITCSLR